MTLETFLPIAAPLAAAWLLVLLASWGLRWLIQHQGTKAAQLYARLEAFSTGRQPARHPAPMLSRTEPQASTADSFDTTTPLQNSLATD